MKFPEYGATGNPVAPHAAAAQPHSCPSCRSEAIVTTPKKPDAGSYWRCNKCGEIWNPGRRDHHRRW